MGAGTGAGMSKRFAFTKSRAAGFAQSYETEPSPVVTSPLQFSGSQASPGEGVPDAAAAVMGEVLVDVMEVVLSPAFSPGQVPRAMQGASRSRISWREGKRWCQWEDDDGLATLGASGSEAGMEIARLIALRKRMRVQDFMS